MSPIDAPRTWFATGSSGETILVRRYDERSQPPSYEVYGYVGDLASDPRSLPLPDDTPESFQSQGEAMDWAASLARKPVSALADVRKGCAVEIDLPASLRTLDMAPLQIGMTAASVVALLGVPESVNRGWEHRVCWFYGSVQVHLRDGQLEWIEIDNGVADFTSLRFENWFLCESSTPTEVSTALDACGASYIRSTRWGSLALEIGEAGRQRFLLDFHADTSRIHAIYWGNLSSLSGA